MPAAIPIWILHAVASEPAAQPLSPSFLWMEIASSYFLLALALLLGLALASAMRPEVTVAIDAQACSWRTSFLVQNTAGSPALPWRDFKSVTEDADYLFLLGWKRSFYIPKRAFASRAEAEAFYEKILQFWHDAK